MIGAFYPYSTAAHITSLVLAALVIWQAPKQLKDDSTDVALTKAAPVQEVSPAAPRRLAWAGLAVAGILAVCQVSIAPPPVSRAGGSQNRLPAFDPHAVPLVGSPDAPSVVTLLFDYKYPFTVFQAKQEPAALHIEVETGRKTGRESVSRIDQDDQSPTFSCFRNFSRRFINRRALPGNEDAMA